ncbi:MAG TPA: amidohydrolase [Acidimicrobiales bacterium]|jgi:5-methylthioadenosine/S-adenosylhomocysteine deaminase|nr:amidohydrolase [Acidimicrobiales bacterium]
MTVRLEADAVFTVDSSDRVLSPGAVEIDAGLISWVGDPIEVPAGAGTEVHRLGGLLMPGLVNCHGHAPMTLLRSAGDGLPLERWLHEAIWPREARLEDEDVYWGMLLGAAEMLGNGVTTTCEQYRHPTAVMDAALEAGIRTMYTPAIFDVPDAGPENTWEALLSTACGLLDATAGRDDRFQMGLGPHAAYTVPPEGLRTIAAEARARDALLQIHLSETEAECQVVRERYGMSAPALLASEGVLEGRVLAAHAVWLDETDLGLLAENDVAVAHCPGSNGKLGSGIAPLRALLERRIRVGLGTDGPASNDDLHLWDEMRLAPLLARAVAGDPDVLTSAAALRLATRGGGEALGLPVGALEAGRPADIIRLRTDDARFTPAISDAELLGHVVWAGAGYLVTDVWVAGSQVVGHGRCSTVDVDRARAEVSRRALRLSGS